MAAAPNLERFLRFIRITGECWEWTGTRNNRGYGTFSLYFSGRKPSPYKSILAHRFSYESFIGPIPDGLQIDHLCRVRHCVNPNHLEPVTARENTFRSAKSASVINDAKTHCPQGHPLSGPNLGFKKSKRGKPARYCRTCAYAANEAWRQRQRRAS